jgi:hypothetical protein
MRRRAFPVLVSLAVLITRKQIIRRVVDKATEFEGEKQHGKNLYDSRVCLSRGRLKEEEREKPGKRAKIYRSSSCLCVALVSPRIHA